MSFNLKDRRQELGLTLEDVGNMVGVGKSTVRKWETGSIQNMGRDKILLLAKAIKISPLDILDPDDGLNDETIKKIGYISSKLSRERRQNVLDYAQMQLEKQADTKVVSMPDTLAAHSDNINEELTPEKLQHNVDVTDEEIAKYIAKQKKDK